MKKFKIAIQMDPVDSLSIESDSTYLIALELQARGHKLFCYEPKDLSLIDNKVAATGGFIKFHDDPENYFELLHEDSIYLEEMDAILIRQDPPFNMKYITTTYLLDLIKDKVLILNNPTELRNNPEKLMVYYFTEFVPPSIISYDHGLLRDFWHKHGDVVIKPIYGHGGNAVKHISPADDCETILDSYLKEHEEIMLQKFFPNISEDGDKRVILIDGKIAGAIGRIPAKGDIRANMVLGGEAIATELTAREKEICETVGPELQKRGLFLAGLDFINEHLIEINLTSPTGLRAINDIYNTNIEKTFVDELEKELN